MDKFIRFWNWGVFWETYFFFSVSYWRPTFTTVWGSPKSWPKEPKSGSKYVRLHSFFNTQNLFSIKLFNGFVHRIHKYLFLRWPVVRCQKFAGTLVSIDITSYAFLRVPLENIVKPIVDSYQWRCLSENDLVSNLPTSEDDTHT